MIYHQGETYFSLRELMLWCALCVVATVALVEAIHAARRRPIHAWYLVLAEALAAIPLGFAWGAMIIVMEWRH